jgi:predicted ATPase
MQQGLAAYQTMARLGRSAYLAQLAEAYGHTGHVEEGLGLLADARTVVEQTGERFYAAEIARLHGELVLRQSADQHAEAAAWFQQALAMAHQQQAKAWELRAAMSLARLWQQQGKRAAACELLAPIYGWFTEGFETADLQEAKVLLEELGA